MRLTFAVGDGRYSVAASWRARYDLEPVGREDEHEEGEREWHDPLARRPHCGLHELVHLVDHGLVEELKLPGDLGRSLASGCKTQHDDDRRLR